MAFLHWSRECNCSPRFLALHPQFRTMQQKLSLWITYVIVSIETLQNQQSACTVTDDEIFMFEIFINWWGDLVGMGSIEDHKGFGALYPQFWGARTTATVRWCKKCVCTWPKLWGLIGRLCFWLASSTIFIARHVYCDNACTSIRYFPHLHRCMFLVVSQVCVTPLSETVYHAYTLTSSTSLSGWGKGGVCSLVKGGR